MTTQAGHDRMRREASRWILLRGFALAKRLRMMAEQPSLKAPIRESAVTNENGRVIDAAVGIQTSPDQALTAWACWRWRFTVSLFRLERYALAEATIVSGSAPLPVTDLPSSSSRTETSACASVPSVTACT